MQQSLPNDIKLLLDLVAKDDEQAFRVIFDHYKAPFHAVAFKMTHSAHFAEEIVQEVFVTMWIKRKLIAAVKKPEPYLFSILYNSVYSHFRKLAQDRRLELNILQATGNSESPVEDLLLQKEERAMLEDVISQLPPQQKMVYKLAKQEGISREEISARLNISPNTVRNHLATAVQFLQTRLKKGVSAIILIFV